MFRLKNWPQNRSKIFYNFALAFDSSSLEKKITHQIKSRSRKRETRETVLSKEQGTVRFKRSLLVARTHTQTLRGSGRRAHRHTHTRLKRRESEIGMALSHGRITNFPNAKSFTTHHSEEGLKGRRTMTTMRRRMMTMRRVFAAASSSSGGETGRMNHRVRRSSFFGTKTKGEFGEAATRRRRRLNRRFREADESITRSVVLGGVEAT